MGNPDLASARSLAQTIRRGDPDALAGFTDANAGRVRAFCAVALGEDSARLQEACDASFLEFRGRIAALEADDADLIDVLLRSTRSAAAGRFEVLRPRPTAGDALAFHADTSICAAMPELVAAAANGELRSDHATVAHQQQSCATCAATAARFGEAEQAFVLAPGPEGGC